MGSDALNKREQRWIWLSIDEVDSSCDYSMSETKCDTVHSLFWKRPVRSRMPVRAKQAFMSVKRHSSSSRSQ